MNWQEIKCHVDFQYRCTITLSCAASNKKDNMVNTLYFWYYKINIFSTNIINKLMYLKKYEECTLTSLTLEYHT